MGQHHSTQQYRDADGRSFARDPRAAEQREEAAYLVLGFGLSVREAAARTGLSKSSVARAVREFRNEGVTPEYARALLAPGTTERHREPDPSNTGPQEN